MNMSSVAIALAAALAFATPSLAQQRQQPSATATLEGGSVAAGIGYVWGDGVLTYEGKTRAFQVHGLSAVGVGAETVQGTAEVYHLNRIDDFPGIYVAASAGGAVGEIGEGIAVLTNRHGVEIRIHTRDRGLALYIAAGGLGISWVPEAL